LNLRVRDGKPVLECRLTGCPPEDILAAIGLSPCAQGKGQTADALSPPSVAPKVAPPTVPAPTSEVELWKETDLLARFARDVERAGLVGEAQNAKIIFLTAVSAKLSKPLNVTVQGSSAAGKNHLMAKVAQFIPEDDQKFLTGMSPKALMHSGEHEFEHKAVFIAEYDGVSGADFAIRTFQSEQLIEWQYVEPSEKGIAKKAKRVKGPAAFIQATTRATLHPENETRLLFIQVDESETQTRAIMERQAVEATGGVTASDAACAGWHGLLWGLKAKAVVIPFAPGLARVFPGNRVRSRRDFPKLLALIEASAFLHQGQRPRDGKGNIVATGQDYSIAKDLFEHCYSSGPDKQVRELLKAAQTFQGPGFSVADLMGQLRWGKTKVYEVLSRAQDLGCIAPDEFQRGRFVLLRAEADPALDLPPDV
jgi:hypothetical protein